MKRAVSVRFTKEELWELINNFGQSFEAGGEGNEVADRTMDKLNDALERIDKEPRNVNR